MRRQASHGHPEQTDELRGPFESQRCRDGHVSSANPGSALTGILSFTAERSKRLVVLPVRVRLWT